MDAAGPNAEQITYWNETSGPKWVGLQSALDVQIAPFGEAAITALGDLAGKRVLDVGCGCGATSLALARRVGASGHVVGADLSEPMLARARERAREAGLANVEFVAADAQTHAFPAAGFDALCSRFGVMFFADPTAAFANLARALRPGAQLAFACWAPPMQNPWATVPMMAAASVVPPAPPPPPGAPGPFAFADRDHVTRILAGAGFEDVALKAFEPTLQIAGTVDLDVATDFLMNIGPAAMAVKDAPADVRQRVRDAVREALRPYHGAEGVRMGSAAWIVTARRP